MRLSLRSIVPILLPAMLAGAEGCVTAHECENKLVIRDNQDNHELENCILLSVRHESLEKKGYWWVAQEEPGGHMVPMEAYVTPFDSGEILKQKGKVVVAVGPYASGHTLGHEYWVFHPGYQPDDFLDLHLERSYERKQPLEIRLLKEESGSSISDEKVLDGARRVVSAADFLPEDNVIAARLLGLVIAQVRLVRRDSYKQNFREQAAELLTKLEELTKKFPKDDSPPIPAEEPARKTSPPPEPSSAPSEPASASSGPTSAPSEPPTADKVTPQAESQPTDPSIRLHDLEPIRKTPP